jgi:Uncharacterised protein family (UPF0236)
MASHDPSSPDPKQDEREARLQRILREMEKQLRAALPDPDQPLEQIEQEGVEIGRALREIIERETLDAAGSGYVGSQAVWACGRPARYVTRNPRTLVTLNGERTFRRAYYHCAACGQGFCPLDQRFRLGRGEQSVGVRALAARFNSYVSERKAAVELELVTGIRLSPRSLQRAGVAVGAALAAEWAERERQLFAQQVAPPPRRPGQLHLAMDGVFVLIGRDWREAKVGEVYQRGADGGVARIAYYATLADSKRFGRRLRTVAQAEGIDYCRERALLGDGAEWIWQEGAKHFPQTDEIVDLFHVLEYLWTVARARFPSPAAQKAWVDAQKQQLLANGVQQVIAAVAGWKTGSEEERKLKEQVVGYLRTHAHRMAYQTYAAKGYHLGSGVAEAGCKQVVQARMKGAGMRWGVVGAEAMLHLRAAVCSTDPADFRAAARRAALPS